MSEWEVRERREREEEFLQGTGGGGGGLGAAGRLGAGMELPLFLPTPSFMASADEERGWSLSLGYFSFVISLVRTLSSWDRPRRRAKGLATCRHRADCGQEIR